MDTVITDVAPRSPGVKLDGEKVQEAPLGRPAQDSATAEVKLPPSGFTVTVNFTDCPCLTLAEAGLAAMEKSAPTPLRFTLGFAEVIPSEPLAVSAPRRVPRAVGLNVTLKKQEVPARTPAVEQVFVCEKSPVIPTPENWKHVPPVLFSVTDCGLLEVPGTWLPKVSAFLGKLTFAVRTNS